ncbi:MAG: hypothetical protein EON91_01515 [Brevundimonas sp.]|uniref:hypothetical protein n=1 Tax=Brevundimonas sp. TaxID=1871086 RepID=UPI0011F44BA6|nr:hypothetical protein [Brevundimonas sp.]RZJ19391.1 MAG: hypothetical protein EON91_01515 [Brevundimonas sp.]
MSDDNVIPLPLASGPSSEDDLAQQLRDATEANRVGDPTPPEEEPAPSIKPQWAAIGAFITLMVIALVASVLVPPALGGGIRWNAAFALLLAGFCAVLVGYYRFNRDAWR